MSDADDDKPKGAERVTKSLDLLIELDEPELFARELQAAASVQGITRGKRYEAWKVIADHALACMAELERLNRPPDRAA
jgi:hypothetical protein